MIVNRSVLRYEIEIYNVAYIIVTKRTAQDILVSDKIVIIYSKSLVNNQGRTIPWRRLISININLNRIMS